MVMVVLDVSGFKKGDLVGLVLLNLLYVWIGVCEKDGGGFVFV